MQSLTKLTKEILKHRGLNPKKYFSQNFLVDKGVYDSIMEAGEVSADDYVIEIGPGLGFLTTELAKKAGKVIAIEIDNDLAKGLEDLESVTSNLEVINQDILKTDLNDLPEFDKNTKYKVIANIPYHLTARIFKIFLSHEHKPEKMVLLVQKEVAERAVAEAGQHSLLSLSIQLYSKPTLVRLVSKSCFYPQPKVDSAVLAMTITDQYISKLKNEELFWKIVKIAFTGKRKKIINTLSNGLQKDKQYFISLFEKLNLDLGSRPQHLEIDDWINLVNELDLDM